MSKQLKIRTFLIQVDGLVQGVGFRPFIYRLAGEYGLQGWVENRNDGVRILINADPDMAERFREEIGTGAPRAAMIESIGMDEKPFSEQSEFQIRGSQDVSDRITGISPDIAVCERCLEEMESQSHRVDYPFINCTHCGPRFTIIRSLPYDRPNTTMDVFQMCPECRLEYGNVNDRRFHAQPVACLRCGPNYHMAGKDSPMEAAELVSCLQEGLARAEVFALKGTGGYHLLCDAFNATAVAALRKIKHRDAKPFALMFGSPEEASRWVDIGQEERELLLSWQRPIVLLKKLKDFTPGIADGLDSLGIMLPYMPLHHMLFREKGIRGLVMTSANISDEPVLISDAETQRQFGSRVNAVIGYNREIHNRCDDSVAMVSGGQPMILRRSRGYAPLPIRTLMKTEGIFAAGAELTASFALGKGNKALVSQYIGDLKNLETMEFYRSSYQRFSEMFRFSPRLLVHDLHPDYLSTRFVQELAVAEGGLPLVGVQHHHAHIASVMLEKGLEGEVCGFVWDGLGLGEDGHLWGGETMVASPGTYRRMFHFEYLPLPGGDRANKEPWRMAFSYLHHCFGPGFRELPLRILKDVPERDAELLCRMLETKLNCPLISSAGRLFDAVAALLGISYRLAYQAEAAMKLESLADPREKGLYPFELKGEVLSFSPMIHALVEDILQGIGPERISAKFHNTLVEAMLDMALGIRKNTEINRVVLSGGSFQNRNLSGNICRRLRGEGFEVFLPSLLPVNDQGIALGQLAVGAFRMKEGLI